MLPFAPGKLLAAACAALLPAFALAAAVNTAEVDRELQLLKDDTIQLSRDLLATERAMLYPERSLTSVYVQVKVSGFLLDSISVRINEAAPKSHTYSNSESLALLKDGGWHRLAQLRLEPGAYRLQAEFSGHFFDARPGEAPVKGRVETLFEKGASELDMVLPISRNTRLDKPGLAEISRMDARRIGGGRNVWMPQPERFEFSAEGNRSGGPTDPRYRTALFLRHDSRYLSALVELSEVLATAADPDLLPGAFYLLMAECYVAFGMDTRAGALYQKVAAGPHDSLTLARARLQLAQFDYQHGRLDGAAERLQAMREKLPSSLREEWRLVMTNVLLAQEKYAETAAMLTEEDSDTPALRYNLAVALIRAGKVAEGREQLDDVGTMDVSNLEQLVLRDKANLTLGYQYLQEQQGTRAREVFGRVRTAGPFSNRALLGLGWSEIAQAPAAKETEPAAPAAPVEAVPAVAAAPAPVADDSLGTLLRPGYVAPAAGTRLAVEGSAAGPSTLPQAEQDALRRALVAWVELVKRDPMDPAVQEGLLAIPWALDRLQAYEQSLTRYLNAISALEEARKRMDEAKKSIQGGRMVETIVRRDTDSERGWLWRLRDLPDVPETFFLQSLLAEHRFQESLKSYRDARLLTRHLDAWKKNLGELERGGPAGSMDAQLKHLRRNWQPAWAGTVVWLDLATALSVPGTFDAPATDAPDTPMELRTGPAPASFAGRAERLKPLRVRIDALRPRVNAIGAAQDDLLEAISARELEGQRATIERYLTEARFAVARIYDRQQQRETP